jgi:effector-binding domain-containing protein
MMLAVDKLGPDKEGIRCSKMPVNGRMLVGRFKGKFSDRTQLNAALERYILDKKLESIVTSYEKYYSSPLPVNELSEVEIEIYYPIL